MGQFLTDLPEERIAKCRLMAADARESANRSKYPEVRAAFTAIAMAWETLIVECERGLDAAQDLPKPAPEPTGLSASDR